jgi:hypothetical protein
MAGDFADDAEDADDWADQSHGDPHRARADWPHAGQRSGRNDPPQDRVDQIWRRFGQVRQRAELLMSRAERILGLAQGEPENTDPA